MRYTYALILVFISQLAMAQVPQTDACVQNIEIAQQKYDEGRIQDIQALLAGCLEAGNYTKPEKASALRLLTLAYIFLDDEVNAEYTMLLLLKTNHEFEVNPVIDPTQFINLHARYRTKPLFNIGGRYIVNIPQPIITDLNSCLNLGGDERYVYNIIFGNFGVGVNFEYEFAKNFIIYPEIHFKAMSLAYTVMQSGVINPDIAYLTVEYFEDQNWLSIPVSVKYILELKNMPKFKVYANLGASVDILLASSMPPDGTFLATPDDPIVGFQVDTTKDHYSFNFGVFAGAGIMVKMGEGFASLEARYLNSFTKFTRPEKVLTPTKPAAINSLAQHDIYRLNHIAFSIGYTVHIYRPKKLK